MIDTNKLTLIDGLGYALDDIKSHTTAEIWDAFSKWFGNKPHFLASNGTKCILSADLQLYIRLRANAIKNLNIKK